MKPNGSKPFWEYLLYTMVLLICLAGLYWRFWYRPAVQPVVVLDPKMFQSTDKMPPKLMLDPDFRWSLVNTEPVASTAYFQENGNRDKIKVGVGEFLGGWQLKSVSPEMAIMAKNGEERSVYLLKNP